MNGLFELAINGHRIGIKVDFENFAVFAVANAHNSVLTPNALRRGDNGISAAAEAQFVTHGAKVSANENAAVLIGAPKRITVDRNR